MSEFQVKFTYSPEGVDPKVWNVDLMRDIRTSEWAAMQKHSGIKGFSGFWSGIVDQDIPTMKALLWVLLKKDMSTLTWDSLDPVGEDMEIRDVDESPPVVRAKLERLKAEGALNADGHLMLAKLIADGVEAEVEDPKA